jgi:N-acetylglutamate synthase-like GNAT family acetyltransferase
LEDFREAVQISIANIEDAEGIVSVINVAFRPAEGFVFDSDPIDLDGVQELMQKGEFLIAEDQGALSGCVYVELRGDRSYLGLPSVDPRRQKTGLGAKLMDAAEAGCAQAGSRHLDLQIVSLRTEMTGFTVAGDTLKPVPGRCLRD